MNLVECLAIAAAVLILVSIPASAQTLDEFKNDGRNAENVLTYGMGYSLHRYGPLKQIDKSSVKHLVPIRNPSLDNQWGVQAQPLVYDSVMSVADAKSTVAIDADTGKTLYSRRTE